MKDKDGPLANAGGFGGKSGHQHRNPSGISVHFIRKEERELRMINLFQDIPAETIETTLDMIQRNLDQIGLYGGHTLRKHTDVQVLALKHA